MDSSHIERELAAIVAEAEAAGFEGGDPHALFMHSDWSVQIWHANYFKNDVRLKGSGKTPEEAFAQFRVALKEWSGAVMTETKLAAILGYSEQIAQAAE